jgi:chemotaxis response regulator CheB
MKHKQDVSLYLNRDTRNQKRGAETNVFKNILALAQNLLAKINRINCQPELLSPHLVELNQAMPLSWQMGPGDPAVSFQHCLPPIHEASKIIVLGANVGGTQAISHILEQFPANCPPVIVVQQSSPAATAAFAALLNQRCAPSVAIASDKDLLRQGHVLVAPPGRHIMVQAMRPGQFRVLLEQGLKINFQRPSLDVLFKSMADTVCEKAVCAVLTGAGDDGVQGLALMRAAGAHTVVQSRETAHMPGLPGKCEHADAACASLPLKQLADHILEAASQVPEEDRLLPLDQFWLPSIFTNAS